MKTLKNKAKRQIDNPIEKILGGTDASSDTVDSIQTLLNWEEVLGLSSKEKNKYKGELLPGEELNLKELHGSKEKKSEAEAAIDYSREIIHVGERVIKRQSQEVEMQLKEVMIEIKKLADSSKELQAQFREVAVEQYVANPGKYHKNFFSWLLSIIRAARAKIEDSNAWLSALHNKKDARKYGAMAKKYGSSFTLNNERTVATQVG
jgi:predicted 3-demethylubiquinone-9 3-methyltransferase (glyoxalase superfamily)